MHHKFLGCNAVQYFHHIFRSVTAVDNSRKGKFVCKLYLIFKYLLLSFCVIAVIVIVKSYLAYSDRLFILCKRSQYINVIIGCVGYIFRVNTYRTEYIFVTLGKFQRKLADRNIHAHIYDCQHIVG